MRAPNRFSVHVRTSRIASSSVLIATLARTCVATNPTSPSLVDQWLYPDTSTLPTYNYLDTVNASWTSDFAAPYLLLRCQHPNDAVHYAFPYNHSVSATGSILVPLDDGNAWVCHFQVSDLVTSSATPPTFISNDFNIVIHDGQKPVLWTDSQHGGETPVSSTASHPTALGPTALASTSSMNSMSSTTASSVNTTSIPISSASSAPATAPTSYASTPSLGTTTPTPRQSSTTSSAPLSPSSGLSKSRKVAIIVGSTMGALLLLVVSIAVLFILRTRRSERNAVVYRSGSGNGDGSNEVPGSEAPRERWKGVEVPSGRMQGYF